MFTVKAAKIILAATLAFSGACRTSPNENAARAADQPKSGAPFDAVEPENYQAEIVTIVYDDETGAAENTIFVARAGNQNLVVYGRGTKNETARLETADGRLLFINRTDRTYREAAGQNTVAADDMSEFLTNEWANGRIGASFEKIGAHDNLTEYRANYENAAGTEVVLTIDENLKMPVKQEFYETSAAERKLKYSFEIKNFQTPADARLFELPLNFKKTE